MKMKTDFHNKWKYRLLCLIKNVKRNEKGKRHVCRWFFFKLSEHNSFLKKTEQKNKEHYNGVIERIIQSNDITNVSKKNLYVMYFSNIHSFCHSMIFSKLILLYLMQIESNVHYFKVYNQNYGTAVWWIFFQVKKSVSNLSNRKVKNMNEISKKLILR